MFDSRDSIWDPEKLIVHYATFSIKSWIPVSATFICHANCLQIAMFIQL
ncbi:hypothetical protein OZD66_01975 [Wolbachia endosymbiont of Drosophila baimaii]|nr:hypothetical protein [Wolbachia endosymbiont of Drosophila baimaii]MDE5058615.1 hypothetical protein [Wolbachia endosymbiont of Drosophila baimaii]